MSLKVHADRQRSDIVELIASARVSEMSQHVLRQNGQSIDWAAAVGPS